MPFFSSAGLGLESEVVASEGFPLFLPDSVDVPEAVVETRSFDSELPEAVVAKLSFFSVVGLALSASLLLSSFVFLSSGLLSSDW